MVDGSRSATTTLIDGAGQAPGEVRTTWRYRHRRQVRTILEETNGPGAEERMVLYHRHGDLAVQCPRRLGGKPCTVGSGVGFGKDLQLRHG